MQIGIGVLKSGFSFAVSIAAMGSRKGAIKLALDVAQNAVEGARADGVLGGVAGAVNTGNPLYAIAVAGVDAKAAIDKGDYQAAAESVTTVVLTVVATVVTARGRSTAKGSRSTVSGPKPGSATPQGAGKAFPESVKERARQESSGRCVFCGKETTLEPGPDRSEIDHSIPKSRGGDNSPANAQNTCRTCNRQKGAKTSQEFQP
jgi:hypothetical protein